MNNNVFYVNIKYLLFTYHDSALILKAEISSNLKNIFSQYEDDNLKLVIFDMKGVKFSSIHYVKEDFKKSVFHFAFNDIIISRKDTDFLFVNATEEMVRYLTERDFKGYSNVFALTFADCGLFQSGTDFDRKMLQAKWNFLDDLSFLNKESKMNEFTDKLISYKIGRLIDTKHCVESIKEKEQHILKSTPVHVNKYINLKPILEDFESFSETCFLLSELITVKFCIPDYIVAPSKNSVSIASGLLRYFKTADLIIINQISPITKMNNYSNVAYIKPNAKYAIVEDFFCMGTEIKVVKGILWSRGVDVEENVCTFPVACTSICESDYDDCNKMQKIYPLYKLDDHFEYRIFTHNSCPACNKLACNHRKLFSF